MCGVDAEWQEKPTRRADTPRLYCGRHYPPDAVRIPADAPFYVTRIALRVAATGAPGERDAATAEALRRIVSAVELAGGLVVDAKVLGGRASTAAADGPPLRLQLAGPREAARTDAPLWRAPSVSAGHRRRGFKKAG